MNPHSQMVLPDPADFPITVQGNASLGARFYDWMKSEFARRAGAQSWDALPLGARLYARTRWLVLLWGPGSKIFLSEAHRFAVRRRFEHAGKHFRTWFDLTSMEQDGMDVSNLPIVRRQWASAQASLIKQSTAFQKSSRIYEAASEILLTRKVPSTSDLARRVVQRLHLAKGETENVRRLLKANRHVLFDE